LTINFAHGFMAYEYNILYVLWYFHLTSLSNISCNMMHDGLYFMNKNKGTEEQT